MSFVCVISRSDAVNGEPYLILDLRHKPLHGIM